MEQSSDTVGSSLLGRSFYSAKSRAEELGSCRANVLRQDLVSVFTPGEFLEELGHLCKSLVEVFSKRFRNPLQFIYVSNTVLYYII